MPKSLMTRPQVFYPEVLGKHHKINREVLKKLLMQLAKFGISDDDAMEIIRASESPRAQAKLKGMINQLLTVYYGMTPSQAEAFINKFGYDEYSFEEMIDAISRLSPGARIGRGLSGLLPTHENRRFMHEAFLGHIIRIAEGLARARELYVDTKQMPLAALNRLAQMDPTPHKKYIEWMARMYVSGAKRMTQYQEIAEFEDLCQRDQIEQKDIGQYKSMEQVSDAIRDAKRKMELKKKKGFEIDTDVLTKIDDADVVYENQYVYIVCPKTVEKSQLYGRNHRYDPKDPHSATAYWCTSTTTGYNRFTQYFIRGGDTFYIILPKDAEYVPEERYIKVNVQVAPEGTKTVWDFFDKTMEESEISKIFKEWKIPWDRKKKESLEEQLESMFLLNEGFARAKKLYVDTKKMPLAALKRLAQKDPTEHKKYIEWMARMYVGGQRSMAKYDVMKDFEKFCQRNQIEQKDIGQYKTIEQVDDAVRRVEAKLTPSQIKKGVKDLSAIPKEIIAFDNDSVIIVVPRTEEESCMYGKGTNWCTSAYQGSRNYFKSYYIRQGVTLYYIIPKSDDDTPDEKYEKVAVATYPDGHKTFFDKEDNSITDAEFAKLCQGWGIPYKKSKKSEESVSEAGKFGSVEWQDEQVKKIKTKLEKGETLDGADRAFIETQLDHNRRTEIEELERMWKLESVHEAQHSRGKCMECDKPPTKEVKWAEGMGHAWFCEDHFKSWSVEHKDDIDYVKEIKDGKVSQKFSDNPNPNIHEASKEDPFKPAGKEELTKRREEYAKQLGAAAGGWAEVAKRELEQALGVTTEFAEYDYYQEMGAIALSAIEGKANNGESEWLIFENEEEAEKAALERVRQDLEDQPEIFNQDFLESHITISETDRHMIAQEEADDLVDNVYSDEDILAEAGVADEYDEAMTDEEKEKILDDARDAVRDSKYDEIEQALEDPFYYFVKERGIYTREDLLKQPFIQIDYDEAAEDAVSADGVAHYLDQYDGESVELPSGAVAYGTN